MREFTDSTGRAWRVWDTMPRMGALLPSDFENGWLTFESDLGRFRLPPVLDGWERFPVQTLEALCRTAREGEARRESRSDAGRAEPP